MSELINTTYEYFSALSKPAHCNLRILRSDTTYVILTELPNNKGMSVINACDDIATRLRQEFGLDPDQTRWIEFSPARERGILDRAQSQPAMYSEITFAWEDYTARDPQWRLMTPGEVDLMLSHQ